MSTSAVPSQTPTLLEEMSVAHEEPHEEYITSSVDVERAEQEFHRLDRVATIESRREILRRRTESFSAAKRKSLPVYDEEQGSEPEPFDLREYLSSTNDKETAHGLKHKHVGVTWEDLEVKGVGGVDHKFYIRTFGQACLEFCLLPYIWFMKLLGYIMPSTAVQPVRTIIQKQSGILKPGEMCLVLGCPGSGCTTFLKAISNQRREYHSITGDIRYAGIDAEEMAKHYKGEVVYNQEDDIHLATLTVGQTIGFALSTKAPGPNARLPGVSRKDFGKEVQTTLLKMLNMEHTKNTLVGNAFVRGVSGGERKRVSIAEMMATRAHVQCWDNSTRGLDASTALDFVKSLRVMTDILGQTVFVSLYQAGEGIYTLFDKVMVINSGRMVYYGPGTEARAYFESLGYNKLPRQSTADYLTGCTDRNERQFAPGRTAADVPSTPEALETTFRKSRHGQALMDDLTKYKILQETEKTDQEAFRAAVLAAKKKGVSKKSPYTLGFFGQVTTLTRRQFQLRIQDRFQLYTSYGLAWILAIVIGAAFNNLPATSAGAFTRGSVIFMAMFTVCLDAFSELPTQMTGRPILHKQTAYGFYRPAAVALSNTLADLPFNMSRIFIFNVIVYFMPKLARSAGGFFTFHLLVQIGFLSMQGFFRLLGSLCINFDSAFRIATFFIPNMVSYAGYIIPIFDMKRWLFWIAYCNPMYYAFAGCMENEFMRISLTCDGTYITPRNGGVLNKYPNGLGPNQVCTLFGSTSGNEIVSGSSYISASYEFYTADLWRRNFLVLLGFFVLFQVLQLLVLEYLPKYAARSSIIVYAKENAETKRLNAELHARKEDGALREKKEASDDGELVKKDFSDRRVFTWENVNYVVPVSGGTLRLLHDVMGYVKPGTLTALMGASGAGKTTCLDVLAQRKNLGVVTGDILVDGRPLDSDFARGTAYAEQMDVHEGTATVREAMRFSAYLRQPFSVSKEEKDAYVEEMIELLELQDLADAMVYTLSVEARKRLTIGVELASKPELLLFLDEPTSGLDSQSAYNLVRFLRKLAEGGQAILCTIHQPSSLLFEGFDRLLLLERGGETVYFGDIGHDSCVIREYFARYGAVCPPNMNPAEYMLEAIGAGVTPRIGHRDWKDIWLESAECERAHQEIQELKAQGLKKPHEAKNHPFYATPFLYQMKTVIQRNNTALWRSPDYVFTRLFVHLFISLFSSLALLQLKNNVRDLQYRVFGIFLITVLPSILMTQIEPLFISNRMTFIREASSRIYSPYVFAIAQLISEIPYSILCAVVYWALAIWPMGFGDGAEGTAGNFYQLLMTIFVEFFGVTLGQLLAAISPTVQIAVLFNPPVGLILALFAGVNLPYPTMAKFWRSWLYWLTPFNYVLAGMLATELHGLEVVCRDDEFAVFSPPSGQTCQQWAGDFVNAFGGYLNNPNATSSCQYCQYRVGDEYFTALNIEFSDRWRNVFLILAYFGFNMFATIIASRFLRFAKR
ncbi:SNQ2_2 [Sanghuangporus vaninii]